MAVLSPEAEKLITADFRAWRLGANGYFFPLGFIIGGLPESFFCMAAIMGDILAIFAPLHGRLGVIDRGGFA